MTAKRTTTPEALLRELRRENRQLRAVIDGLSAKGTEPYVAVELTWNAKGDTQSTVKVSAPLADDVNVSDLLALAGEVRAVAQRSHEAIREDYPRSNGA